VQSIRLLAISPASTVTAALHLPCLLLLLLQMVSIVSTQLDDWAAAGPINLAAEGKSLSFEFSTKLLVSLVRTCVLCVLGGEGGGRVDRL
jgi:hypothetical protein